MMNLLRLASGWQLKVPIVDLFHIGEPWTAQKKASREIDQLFA
ncbi:hypothetical protein ACFOUP_18235 [Belliella kenyensis]|uniref:Uncharacterized protein n=1 Tax=Belliella kenyensis TaxID=1472724 RepID=A0ABV8EPR4_9BACT|nr:hypothetical protein [Belliella kenyensis]MDN3601796.1 hypothetical protein [Belliella kenyensis]